MFSDKTINLNRLEIFKAVASTESFSKAALQLKQPKSRVSRNISALEKELGIQLIYRTTRHLKLTEPGRMLFEKCSPLLNEMKRTLELISESSDEIKGSIKVTVPEDIGSELMGPIIAEFLTLYPQIRFTILSSNKVIDLIEESVDVAVRIGKVKDSTMIQKKIGNMHVGFYVSPNFLKKNSFLKITDLESIPFLCFLPRETTNAVKLYKGKETKKIKLKPMFFSNNLFTLRSMALQGMGILSLPTFLAKNLVTEGKLIPVFTEWSSEPTPVQILIPQQKEVPAKLKKFIDFLHNKLSFYLQS